MSDTFRVSGGPPVTLDDGREVRFGGTFDLDDLDDDELLQRLLDSGQVTFVVPVVDEPPIEVGSVMTIGFKPDEPDDEERED